MTTEKYMEIKALMERKERISDAYNAANARKNLIDSLFANYLFEGEKEIINTLIRSLLKQKLDALEKELESL